MKVLYNCCLIDLRRKFFTTRTKVIHASSFTSSSVSLINWGIRETKNLATFQLLKCQSSRNLAQVSEATVIIVLNIGKLLDQVELDVQCCEEI